jgi:hypothetical protein
MRITGINPRLTILGVPTARLAPTYDFHLAKKLSESKQNYPQAFQATINLTTIGCSKEIYSCMSALGTSSAESLVTNHRSWKPQPHSEAALHLCRISATEQSISRRAVGTLSIVSPGFNRG